MTSAICFETCMTVLTQSPLSGKFRHSYLLSCMFQHVPATLCKKTDLITEIIREVLKNENAKGIP